MSYPSDALRFANKVLRKLDCAEQPELLKGRPNQPTCCPIANTISAGIDSTHPKESLDVEQETYDLSVIRPSVMLYATKWDGNDIVDRVLLPIPVPKGAQGFMERFDAGKYPEFDRTVK
jgi:hypothetical protein